MIVKNLRGYLNLLPSDFDNKEVRFINGNNIFVMGNYVEPVDENDVEKLEIEVEKW